MTEYTWLAAPCWFSALLILCGACTQLRPSAGVPSAPLPSAVPPSLAQPAESSAAPAVSSPAPSLSVQQSPTRDESSDETKTVLAGPRPGQVDHVVKSVDPGALPRLVIAETKQIENEDEQSVVVEATLRNEGGGPTKKIQVTVNALSEAGQIISTASLVPTSQVISPGGKTTVAAHFSHDPAIRQFSIKADFR